MPEMPPVGSQVRVRPPSGEEFRGMVILHQGDWVLVAFDPGDGPRDVHAGLCPPEYVERLDPGDDAGGGLPARS